MANWTAQSVCQLCDRLVAWTNKHNRCIDCEQAVADAAEAYEIKRYQQSLGR